ncbi:MAG: hypothetical protein WCP28_03925 [Actinomycetes bacterium]
MVAFPFTAVTGDLSPDAPQRLVIGKDDLGDVATQVRAVARGAEPAGEPSSPGWVVSALNLLLGRGKPARDFVAEAAVHEGHVDRLTTDQYTVLDLVERNRHIEVVGGAGSGKTWLAFEQARRWSAQGHRVAMLTFGRGLATYLTDRTAGDQPSTSPRLGSTRTCATPARSPPRSVN